MLRRRRPRQRDQSCLFPLGPGLAPQVTGGRGLLRVRGMECLGVVVPDEEGHVGFTPMARALRLLTPPCADNEVITALCGNEPDQAFSRSP